MIEFYPEIRLVHITAALASGGLFLFRGVVLFTGRGRAVAAPLRYLSYTIDTILLTAALMLMTIVQQYPFVHAWLTVKVLLVVIYVALGLVTFSSGHATRAVRLGCWLTALTCYTYIFSVARAYDPLGFLIGILD